VDLACDFPTKFIELAITIFIDCVVDRFGAIVEVLIDQVWEIGRGKGEGGGGGDNLEV